MDYSTIQLIISVVSAAAGAIGFMELRMQKLYNEMKEKLADKQEINKIIQTELKEQIVRLEDKIDTLIRLSLNRSDK